ncbi:DoxX family protein [Pyxidicoccus xibeiensis]|uniref:DoxX family protein n=1 Tax=Pyxidicoccus xibeiensis TaxID=2906759 RepID=UPI0020A7E89D|nr:DoxX family protein [Pyxidicoccus xibeiensis]MCP3139471.1 DoxX family protein [Pyxidicoccus xibeiensis]
MTSAAPQPAAPEPLALHPSPPLPGPPMTVAAPEPWGLVRRIAFRFALAYLFLYSFPSPLDALPGTDSLVKAISEVGHTVIPWVGKHVLRLETDITIFTNGSGDTTYNYVQVLVLFAVALVAAAVGSIVDRRRTQYVQAHDVLRVYVRYVLAMSMLSYGLAKVFHIQFSFPQPERFVQPLGEFSPMGLVWTFMGYSSGYTFLAGAAECVGGLLLLFRRTTSLGAVVLIGVMGNVVALNFFYDIPVKLYSSHLLLMAVFLLLPDAQRLLHVLLLNRPTTPRKLATPVPLSQREARGVLALRVLFLGAVAWAFFQEFSALNAWFKAAAQHALLGLYTVESFTRDGQVLPPLLGDTTRWRYAAVSSHGRMTVRLMDDTAKRFGLKDDAAKGTVTLTDGTGDAAKTSVLTYSQPDAEHLVLQGPFQDGTIEVHLKKVDVSQFLLVRRGFNWIQEYPFNR